MRAFYGYSGMGYRKNQDLLTLLNGITHPRPHNHIAQNSRHIKECISKIQYFSSYAVFIFPCPFTTERCRDPMVSIITVAFPRDIIVTVFTINQSLESLLVIHQ